ncbi:pseudouridylate synthase [Phialemonium atrogriseum]|uniref:Pseudouridylate synthase n=1 Tax=Phialemonium atrogriseum TaxID=1093897 RepID=A0AAJ0C908_9PEZI|nr:pseudouridylate synthase [Phialemonium atrogriseum]KAK1772385.1 pseudouridylate synthase [Phialemonium atrogriseum]
MSNLSHAAQYIRRAYEVTTKHCARSLASRNPHRQTLRTFSINPRAMADQARDYKRWTKESLVKRVKCLEEELKRVEPSNPALGGPSPAPPADAIADAAAPDGKKQKKKRKLDPSKYSTRLIALKIAYLGKNYNGFEYQTSASVPTIEEELWKALTKSCLISPDKPDEVDFGPWEYSKCGRTDRGVSAFGQVIGIRVRSNRPLPRDDGDAADDDKPAWDPVADEIAYCRILNRLLPADIRAVAWCPNLPPGFSARFSCRERQYRYFFTQPAFAPMPSNMETARAGATVKEGWLDIQAMREAAKSFEGLHDFRNFCKVDPGKQMTNFMRRMFEADIVEVEDVQSAVPFLNGPDFRPDGVPGAPYPKVYYFHVRGSAFLWHQIRHMVGILFAVGQGLEPPSIVSELLDVEKHPRKPNYVMADEVPLVLWDCIFPDLDDPLLKGNHDTDFFEGEIKDSMDWLWLGEDSPLNLYGSSGVIDHLWGHWREKKMDELLANRLLDWASTRVSPVRATPISVPGPGKRPGSQRVFEGGNGAKYVGKYIPVLKRQLLQSPEEMNDKWAQTKGFANAEELSKTKNWRTALKEAKNDARTGAEAGEEGSVEMADASS